MVKEELCNCGSNYIFGRHGIFYCSHCKKPTGVNFKDLTPMTNEELKKLAKEVIK